MRGKSTEKFSGYTPDEREQIRTHLDMKKGRRFNQFANLCARLAGGAGEWQVSPVAVRKALEQVSRMAGSLHEALLRLSRGARGHLRTAGGPGPKALPFYFIGGADEAELTETLRLLRDAAARAAANPITDARARAPNRPRARESEEYALTTYDWVYSVAMEGENTGPYGAGFADFLTAAIGPTGMLGNPRNEVPEVRKLVERAFGNRKRIRQAIKTGRMRIGPLV